MMRGRCPGSNQISAGLNDAWFNPATPGQGFFFTAFPVIGKAFIANFTFDSEPPDEGVMAHMGSADQRWADPPVV